MAEVKALKELRAKELITLSERVERRVKIKAGPRRIRRIAGMDLVVTPQAHKVHVCTSLVSFPKLEIIEEVIATDELDTSLETTLGTVCFVPLLLSVLKMLKENCDVIMLRELSLKHGIPLSSYVGVISGKPAVGVLERATGLKKVAEVDGVKRAGPVKLRGHKTQLGVVAGHLMTFKDAWQLVKACAKESRMPDPVRVAGLRVRAWEREWRRINLGGR